MYFQKQKQPAASYNIYSLNRLQYKPKHILKEIQQVYMDNNKNKNANTTKITKVLIKIGP